MWITLGSGWRCVACFVHIDGIRIAVATIDRASKMEMSVHNSLLDDNELQRILNEDVRFGDLTTSAMGIGDFPGRMTFSARSEMTVCCAEEAERMLVMAGCVCSRARKRGTRVEADALLLETEGRAAALHRVWKTAQTLIEYASGIATATAKIVMAAHAQSAGLPVACTRKNFPGTRAIAAMAIAAGGATAHRLGLSETLLVFAEHRAFLPGDHVQYLVQGCRT